MAIRALLLDFDGTLADSLPALRRVYERFVTDLGGKASSGEFDVLNGPRLREVVESLCMTHQGRPHAAEDLEEYRRLIADEVVRIEPARGARDLLEAARTRGIRCAIVTSSRTDLVESWLDATGLQVALIVSGDDAAEGKPSPEPYVLALERLGLGAEEALAIEDSLSGVRSATAAGIRTLWLAGHRNDRSEFECIEALGEALLFLNDSGLES